MAQDKAVVHSKILEFIGKVQEHVRVDKVILYGSWAKGNPTDLSDIDLAVFSPDFGKHILKESQLLSRIAWEVDESIEAIPYAAEDLYNLEPTKFVYEIIRTGETVFDKAWN
ncbi:MAG: nucleotidyltransferase domain-containing protein [Firmicutes bacterium]|nr:nucleotidyltransferase domain-containing protein [Bacillota bacterium]